MTLSTRCLAIFGALKTDDEREAISGLMTALCQHAVGTGIGTSIGMQLGGQIQEGDDVA